jgi:hypothetical protein
VEVIAGELFQAGLAKLFPETQRAGLLHAFRLHVRLNGERLGFVVREIGDSQLRVVQFFVDRRVGRVRIFFEIAPERIVLWSVTRAAKG